MADLSPEEYLREYRKRLGHWMKNPFDGTALFDWLAWIAADPGPFAVFGGAR